MMARLWRGQLPLSEAFWTHAIIIVAIANLAATVAALLLVVAGGAGLLALAIYLSPAPYVVAAVVGVWRSAEQAQGGPLTVLLARWVAVVWGIVMTLL